MHPAQGARDGFLLAVAEHPWPSTSGGQLRTAGIAAALTELGPLTVVSLNMPNPPPQLVGPLGEYWRRRRSQPTRLLDLAGGIVRGNHVSLQRAIAAGLPAALATLVAELNPRVVILGRPFFGPFIAAARTSGSCVILDPDESLVRVSRSVMRSNAAPGARARAFLDLLAAGRMERRDFHTADQIWTGSAIEARGLRRAAGRVLMYIVPNVSSRIPAELPEPGPIRQIGFVGSFGHPPNEEAAIELMTTIMPAIRTAGGPRELVLIGRDPSARMRRLAAEQGEVAITGQVNDTNLVLREAGVLVSPIRSGGGTRLKVIEAAAAGVPIVSTAFGVEGLDLRPGEEVLLADTPNEFAEAVRRLVDEPDLGQVLARRAFRAISDRHSPATLRRAVGAALADCPPTGNG